ncbi:hypothetical protein [Calothrix sp. NIES-2098]|uniref:hypothetical protein n=1 Tax=Calothrix sp. NIES-2098 TaxID=1954171 RepID=UPI000B616A4F|nr:hypothetical protein NIES2098_25530 [Calothrix sp. NIES-2098]
MRYSHTAYPTGSRYSKRTHRKRVYARNKIHLINQQRQKNISSLVVVTEVKRLVPRAILYISLAERIAVLWLEILIANYS